MTTEMEMICIAALSMLGSGVGTISGFGMATIMTPGLLLFLSLPQTLLLVAVIHWFGSIWQFMLFRKGIKWRLILAFGIPGIFASIVGASISLRVPEYILSRMLGGILIVYVLIILANPRFKLHESLATASIGGTSYGFLAGIVGIGGAVRSIFLSAYDLHKVVYIATSGAIAFAIDSARIAAYLTGGASLDPSLFLGLLFFILASLLGSIMGKKIVERVPQERFRSFIAGFMFLAGLKLAVFP
jgi:uncharacterized membrane protein YfcA